MALPVYIVGANGKRVHVNRAGELLIADGPYDETVFNELAADDTPYNFYGPKDGMQFVITNVLAYGDKQVASNSNATVIIYEADAPNTLTVGKVLVQFEIGQNQSLPFTGLKILVASGVYVNAKTDDDDVHMTVIGHFIPLL